MSNQKAILAVIIALLGTLAIVYAVQFLPLGNRQSLSTNQNQHSNISKSPSNQSNVTIIGTSEELGSILKQKTPLVIKFFAPWCGACRMMNGPIDAIAQELKGKVNFYEVNVDNNQVMQQVMAMGVAKDGVNHIPTFVYIKNGSVHEQTVGGMDQSEMTTYIKKAFSLK